MILCNSSPLRTSVQINDHFTFGSQTIRNGYNCIFKKKILSLKKKNVSRQTLGHFLIKCYSSTSIDETKTSESHFKIKMVS